jgi:hypothetical protein
MDSSGLVLVPSHTSLKMSVAVLVENLKNFDIRRDKFRKAEVIH